MKSAKTSHSDPAGQQQKLTHKVMSWRPRSGTIPLPLWLQGTVEALLVALTVAVLAAIGPLAVFSGSGVAGAGWNDLGVWWAQSWLVLHGAPLSTHVADLPASTVGSTATQGSFHIWPMAMLAILIWLAHRAGSRLARATTGKRIFLPVAGALAGYTAAATVAWAASYHEVTSANWYNAIFIPLGIFTIGLGLGIIRHYGSWSQWWEDYAAPRFVNLSQRSRWQLSYLWACVRAATVVLLGLFAGAAAIFGLQLVISWMAVVNLQQEFNLGVSGALAIAGINFTLLGNFVIWTMAWITGAGFGLGEGNIASLFETAVGPVPAFPLLGMVPTNTEPWMWLVLLVPLAAGGLGGWWFIREGENHVDEALDVRVNHRWMSLSASTLIFGVLLAGILWLYLVPLYFFAGIDLGVGRLHNLGPDPVTAALFGSLFGAAGAMLGYLVAPLLSEALTRLLPDGLGINAAVARTRPHPTTATGEGTGPAEVADTKILPEDLPDHLPADRTAGYSAKDNTTDHVATPRSGPSVLGRLKRPRRTPTTAPQPPQSITAERELPRD